MITSSIQNTENEEELYQIAMQHGERFDFINTCACMVKLAKMVVAASSTSTPLSSLPLTVVGPASAVTDFTPSGAIPEIESEQSIKGK
jgi:hypothetical protein